MKNQIKKNKKNFKKKKIKLFAFKNELDIK